MKRILFYVRMTPVQILSPAEILLGNKFMSNSGNLLFAASVARTVMTKDVELVPFFSEDIDGMLKRIDEINANYDCVVIPLANAFRWNYIDKLRKLTSFVRAVRIPCYVIGVGIQASAPEKMKQGFFFDEDVRRFVSSILEKSALIGLRGEYTANYLEQLGFLPDQHFTVIGCPSAYINGGNCREVRIKPYDEMQRVSVNAKLELHRNIHHLIGRSIPEFQDVNFVVQDLYEYWAMYFPYRRGRNTRKLAPEYYPYSNQNPLWREGRVLGFLQAQEWLKFMETRDFSFGSRIHGNMAAITAGTPALIAVNDARILELVQYHGIPYIWKEDIKPETRLRDLYEQADFGDFKRKYARNFENYVHFMNRLGLDHIYDGKTEYENGAAPYDRALAAAGSIPAVHSAMKVPLTEKMKGFGIYPQMLRYWIDRQKLIREKQQ